MILRKGDMWDSGADVICVTGNDTIRSDGAVVMGRGAALECQMKYPGINLEFGKLIRAWHKEHGPYEPYGVVVVDNCLTLGLFQVKWNFKDAAVLDLIRNSCTCLMTLAMTDYRNASIAVNFPGIGWGKLKRKDVLPILISHLPDNVEVWEK